MKLSRKFNLSEIGKPYESFTFEIDGDKPLDLIARIEECYKIYIKAIKDGKVR